MRIGNIIALSTRPAKSSSLERGDSVVAIAGKGLRGDAHADALSPRQLLLASAAAYDEHGLPVHALRENLLVDFDTAQLASGMVLQVGDEVMLRMMFQCEACGQLDAQRAGLARQIGARRGMLARVISDGVLRRGDPVRDLGLLMPAWSDDWRERVVQVLDALPERTVIEYKQLARLAGIQSSYCRAFPRMIKSLGSRYTHKAVSSQSASPLARWLGDGLFDDHQRNGYLTVTR